MIETIIMIVLFVVVAGLIMVGTHVLYDLASAVMPPGGCADGGGRGIFSGVLRGGAQHVFPCIRRCMGGGKRNDGVHPFAAARAAGTARGPCPQLSFWGTLTSSPGNTMSGCSPHIFRLQGFWWALRSWQLFSLPPARKGTSARAFSRWCPLWR